MRTILFLLLAAATLGLSRQVAAQSPDETFQRALRLERTQGDYATAIDLYEHVIAATDAAADRPLRGRAMMQLARAYENLGRTEAARTYQRVMADFSDMVELVEEARAGYARTREPAPVTSTEVPVTRTAVRLGPDFDPYGGGLSPTGRYLSGMAEDPFGIRILDLQTGNRRLVSIPHGPDDWAQYVRFSPDEEQIAVGVARVSGPGAADGEVLLIDISSGEVMRTVDLSAHYRERGMDVIEIYPWVQDWSRDGSALLVLSAIRGPGVDYADGRNRQEELLRVPADGSPPHLLFGMTGGEDNGYEQSYFSGDGRYAFTDVCDKQDCYIRRFDSDTGENIIWRRGTRQSWLWGSTWDSDRILYAQYGLAGPVIRAADPAEVDASRDRLVAELPKGSWPISGSKQGDLAGWLDAGDDWKDRVVRLDDPTGEPVEVFDKGYMQWSPTGTYLLHRERDTGHAILWRDDRSRTPVDVPHEAVRVGWNTGPDRIYYAMEKGGDQGLEYFVLDPAGGRAERLDASPLFSTGISGIELTRPGGFVGWNRDSNCVMGGGAGLANPVELRCLDGTPQRVRFEPSPFEDRTVVNTLEADTTWNLAVMALDGSGYREVYGGYRSNYRPRWLSSHEIGIAVLPKDSRHYSEYRVLDLETGEAQSIARDLFDRFNISDILVSPGREYAAFRGGNRSDNTITIVHEVDGGGQGR